MNLPPSRTWCKRNLFSPSQLFSSSWPTSWAISCSMCSRQCSLPVFVHALVDWFPIEGWLARKIREQIHEIDVWLLLSFWMKWKIERWKLDCKCKDLKIEISSMWTVWRLEEKWNPTEVKVAFLYKFSDIPESRSLISQKSLLWPSALYGLFCGIKRAAHQ